MAAASAPLVTDRARELQRDVVDALRAHGSPTAAPQMQAYLKSSLPFDGVPAPVRARVLREVFARHPLPDRAVYERSVLLLWDDASRREHRYAALALARLRRYRAWRDSTSLGLYRHLVVTGAWWDLVDDIASHLVGEVLQREPAAVAPVLRAWAGDDDLWLRRTAILSQLPAKAATDQALLSDCLAPNVTRPEFFLRKAMGWALREYSRTDPTWVRNYVTGHPELSPLTRREATRNLPSQDRVNR